MIRDHPALNNRETYFALSRGGQGQAMPLQIF
jgi:hypothetical protein